MFLGAILGLNYTLLSSRLPVTPLSLKSLKLFSLSHLSKTLLSRVHGEVLDCVGRKSFRFLLSSSEQNEKNTFFITKSIVLDGNFYDSSLGVAPNDVLESR